MWNRLLESLVHAGCGPLYAVTLADPRRGFAVEKVLAPELENPDGSRQRIYGRRALQRVLSI